MPADRRRMDGAILQTEQPMSLPEKLAWCALYACIVGGGIGLCLYFTGAN